MSSCFECQCGNRLFHENTQCVACSAEVGWCPGCRRIVAVDRAGDGANTLTCTGCGVSLVPCRNRAVENVCNRYVLAPEPAVDGLPLCRSCGLTTVLPDLDVPGNRERWARLEEAKRRLLVQLDAIGLPYGEGVEPPLSFEFKGSGQLTEATTPAPVRTGHVDGTITIDVVEADDDERESRRVRFGEEHRTLVGHFRHEIGHFYWQALVPGRCDERFRDVFGDHENPAYGAALARYHETGPAPDWGERFVSAYASAHPWEDFAETFKRFLDIASVVGTASGFGMGAAVDVLRAPLADVVRAYSSIGLMVNELNRSLGLVDLVPGTIVPAVEPKVEFIRDLIVSAAEGRAGG